MELILMLYYLNRYLSKTRLDYNLGIQVYAD